ncbi:hypothetical protein GYA19_02400 [Candidatus Beckwithbacteria bacterium]|nr:hypothetical protein [Candidatus Beckwithbacteria bacterium]
MTQNFNQFINDDSQLLGGNSQTTSVINSNSNQSFDQWNQNQLNQPLETTSFNFSAAGKTFQEDKINLNTKKSISGLVKLLVIIIIPLLITASIGLYINAKAEEGTYQQAKKVLLSVAMTNVNWSDLGTVFEPIIPVQVKNKSDVYEECEFLLDSGAVISSLPREWAEKMGKDLAMMKRSTFKGYGGTTSFAYQGEMTLLLGGKDVTIPVVFTESSGTKYLLGRKGFFENYSVYFNHNEKKIEIRE